MVSILRITRTVADRLVVSVLLLIVSLRLGMLDNVGVPYPAPFLERWEGVAEYTVWVAVPLTATLLAFKTRRWAGWVCLTGVPVAYFFPPPVPFLLPWATASPLWLQSSFWSGVIIAVFVAVGLYWISTSAAGCLPVLALAPLPSRRRRRAFVLGGSLVCVLAVIWTALIGVAPPSFWGESGIHRPYTQQLSPYHAVFIASDALHLGTERAAWDTSWGPWEWLVIARVQEHFWGLPWWDHKFVFLVRPPHFYGQTYFFDGVRPAGLLAQFLPIVTLYPGSRTNLVKNAEIDLRVLKDGQSRKGARIIGEAILGYRWSGTERREAGFRVAITGPAGSMVTTTDGKGVYDFPGLPPGRYSVHFDLPPNSRVQHSLCDSPIQLEPGQIVECDAYYQ